MRADYSIFAGPLEESSGRALEYLRALESGASMSPWLAAAAVFGLAAVLGALALAAAPGVAERERRA